MTYQLRDYQKSASDAAVSVFKSKEKKNYVIVLPTGAGKSLVIANIAARIDGPLIVFQPSKEILEQNFAKLQSYGIFDCGVYSASAGRKDINRITFAMIGSVMKHMSFITLPIIANVAPLLSSSLQHKIWDIFIFVREQLPANHTGYTLQLFFTKHISVVFLIENHTGFH